MISRIFRLTPLLCCLLFALNAPAAPLREPLYQKPPADLMTPASGNLYEIPVVSICYLPTRDGVRLDPDATDLDASLYQMYEKITMMNRQIKFALEEGSRYHGYMDRNARPTLGYKVVAMITLNEDLPRDPIAKGGKKDQHQADYNKILERFKGRDWVDKEGIKEFWVWSYHYGDLDVTESNMSSPLTGNVSNSVRREGDMPIYEHSYIVYNYNYERSAAEAIHNHGHQLESMLSWVNKKQDGNTALFWEKFVGRPNEKQSFPGRCGWTHCPANTGKDYDYLNPKVAESDIVDWRPDGSGRKMLVSDRTWGEIPYPWPGGIVPEQKTEAQWYIFWRQNIPGENNGLSVDGQGLTNWWDFVGDWDGAARRNLGLHKGPLKTPLAKSRNVTATPAF